MRQVLSLWAAYTCTAQLHTFNTCNGVHRVHDSLPSLQVLILAGGVFVFHEAMPLKKLLGVLLTMSGIAW
jgi:hypothetical protein